MMVEQTKLFEEQMKKMQDEMDKMKEELSKKVNDAISGTSKGDGITP
jgi:DNA-binding protein YbaB